jgi:hypothetical protein
MEKDCTECGQPKKYSEYCYRSIKNNILHEKCKECMNKYASEYRKKNKEKIKIKQKEWVENNQEYIKNYKIQNREHSNELSKKKYSEDLNYRMKKILRSRFSKTVKNKKTYSKIINYLGVPLEYFKKWIEYQFDENMTWENQGTYWDFVHVKPCSSFDLTKEDEIKLCFVWHNISPLEKSKNYSKNAKIDNIVINNVKKLKEKFISLYPVPNQFSNELVA